ncbi:unnamed protein product, partial [Effrenium voratum]
FATCARTCERTLQWEQALALFEVARAGQTSISGLLNAVSGASGRAGRWEDAMSWLQVACEQRLDNVVTYNTAANACVKAARWSKALDIFSRTPAPNAASFTTALHACEDHWEDALGLLADMTAAALQPELADFRTYARALGRARHWQQAVQLQQIVRGEKLSDRRGSLWSVVAWACQASGVGRPLVPRWMHLGAWKELELLAHVQHVAPRGSIDAALDAVEDFAQKVQWLKVLGGAKARLLQSSLRPGDNVVELGSYVGYSALLLLQQLRKLGQHARASEAQTWWPEAQNSSRAGQLLECGSGIATFQRSKRCWTIKLPDMGRFESPPEIRWWSAEVESICRFSRRRGADPDWLSFQAQIGSDHLVLASGQEELRKVLRPWVTKPLPVQQKVQSVRIMQEPEAGEQEPRLAGSKLGAVTDPAEPVALRSDDGGIFAFAAASAPACVESSSNVSNVSAVSGDSRKGHRRMYLEQFDSALELIADKRGMKLEDDTFKAYSGNKPDLDGKTFVKLCKDCEIIDDIFTPIDADLVFAKAKPRARLAITAKGKPPQGDRDDFTMVFTDVQGSTSLWESNPRAMEMALRLHDATIRQVLAKHSGYEVTTEGDAFQIAFHDTCDAVAFCLDTQAELLRCDWPAPTLGHTDAAASSDGAWRGLRVRMGLHSGRPAYVTKHEVTGRWRYAGPSVAMAKAIEGVCHGGQIIMSASSYHLIDGMLTLLGSPQVVDLGEHILEGHGLTEDSSRTGCSGRAKVQLIQLVPDLLSHEYSCEDPADKATFGGGRKFPPIESEERASPGFEESPAGSSITLCFVFTAGARELVATDPVLASQSLGLLRGYLREVLRHAGDGSGYECQEDEGAFMLAFANMVDASVFSTLLQRKLPQLPWPAGLLERGPRYARGLQVSIGALHGAYTSRRPHATTGRADYFGTIVNRTARIAAAAHPGQVLLGGDMPLDADAQRRLPGLQWQQPPVLPGYPQMIPQPMLQPMPPQHAMKPPGYPPMMHGGYQCLGSSTWHIPRYVLLLCLDSCSPTR